MIHMTHDRLRLLRLKRRIPAKALAKLLGVTPAALCRWETGTRRPTEEHLQAWKRALR